MKLQRAAVLAGVGALILANEASANYVGLSVELHAVVTIGGTQRAVYRVYAVFSNPDDYLLAIAGSPQGGALVIQNRNATNNAFGSGFVNPVGGGNFAPYVDTIKKLPNAQWDTFATVGVAINDGTDQTAGSPGMPVFISGAQLVSNSISWFTSGPMEQGRAGGPNSHPIGGGLGILLTQLTVKYGENVRGTVSVSGINAGDGPAVFTANAQTFETNDGTPCPADANLDGLVNVDDLLIVIGFWHATPPAYEPADINQDGTVNVDDLLAVINGWGSCFPEAP